MTRPSRTSASKLVTLASALLLCAIPGAALGGPCIDVLIVARLNHLLLDEVADELVTTGFFNSVSHTSPIAVHDRTTPLAPYDALFLYHGAQQYDYDNDSIYDDLFNRYNAFRGDGGGLVLVQPSLTHQETFPHVYWDNVPVSGPGQTCSTNADWTLEPSLPESPLLEGVSDVVNHAGGERFCSYQLLDDAVVHAMWSGGQPAVVVRDNVVAINVWGVPDTITNAGYPADSDMPQLLANALVYAAGFNPATACNGDTDDDGLRDEDEELLGTDPHSPDTDGDGVNDGIDNCPLVANPDQLDTNGNGVGDACDTTDPDTDTDSDSDPDTDTDTDTDTDSDGDGIPDADDNCPDDPNPNQEDRDADGVGDACQPAGGVFNCAATSGSGVPALSLALLALATALRRRRR